AAPLRSDIKFGAVREGDDLLLILTTDQHWEGKLIFDAPRHQEVMNLPTDWPRINQFPEWFTAKVDQRYEVIDVSKDSKEIYTGEQLQSGIPFNAEPGEYRFLVRMVE
ncbi:MAG: hypothetical protein WBA23_22935, partial [Tunicatimonas sp.]